MADDAMVMVYCYDVAEDRDRRRLAKVLEARCLRVQKSVFEARLSQRQALALLRAAGAELGPGDSLRMYALGAHGLRRSRVVGGAPLPEEREFYLL